MTDKKTYEGMFLVDAGNPDFEASSEPVRTVLDRSEAEVLSIKPWDERKLAYEIKGRKRGLYVLTYFKIDPGKVAELERDAELSESIIRMLLLRRDHLTEEQLNAKTPAMSIERSVSRDVGDQPESDESETEGAEIDQEAEDKTPFAEGKEPEDKDLERD